MRVIFQSLAFYFIGGADGGAFDLIRFGWFVMVIAAIRVVLAIMKGFTLFIGRVHDISARVVNLKRKIFEFALTELIYLD